MNTRLRYALIALTIGMSSDLSIGQDFQKTLSSVNPEEIKATMTFLADDLLEGRQPGTRGFAIASKYVETQFMALGLLPGVNGNTYVQKVPLRKGVIDASRSSLSLIINGKTETLTLGKEFLLSPYFLQSESAVKASLVFAGFGVSAPELGYDDYKSIDVKGKIIVILNGAPTTFPSNERAYFSSASKLATAIKRGAVGIISISPPTDIRTSWDASVRRTRQGAFKWLNAQGEPVNSNDELKAVINFNPAFAEKLFSNSGKNIQTIYDNAKANVVQSFALQADAQIVVKTIHSFVESSNLIGVLPGSDPVLKNEFVVYAAHLDHFGIGTPVKGDSIYNGAHDDASGVSILLSIVRAFRSMASAPSRSVIFAVVTGEENGLLGSDYFINNCTVNSNNVVANLSIDMPFFFHPVLDIVPYGAQHSSLSVQVDKAAAMLNLKISPDPFPEQVVFIRSDHYSFIKKGIPSLFIKSGFMTVKEDLQDRPKTDIGWRSTVYHTPQDDMSQSFDFNGAATHAKVSFLIGYFVCNAPARPAWNPGDFFGGKFGTK